MSYYYTINMFLCVFSMLIMQSCVMISGTIPKNKKRLFLILFRCIILAAFCEWFGIWLQGRGASTTIIHIIVKAIELSVAPAIGFMIAWIVDDNNRKGVILFLIGHSILEILSGIFGFIYVVDAQSNYMHANFYWIYIAAYMASIVYCMYIVKINVKKYQYSGMWFFLLIVLFMVSGIAVQLYDSNYKVIYIALALTSIMLYVFHLEMVQQTDALTSLINRRGYENYISHIDGKNIILFFDVDRLKQTNDEYGHVFGDHCLKTIGDILRDSYAAYGKCFRIGGDEFCVLLNKDLDNVEDLNTGFFNELEKLRSKEKRLPHVSVGYVYFDSENNNIQDAINEADEMMYKFKQQNRKAQE